MSLGRQVHSLLKRHSTVFVKGLGTFRRIRTSASFDAKRKVVLPPISYIEFEHNTEEGFDYTLYIQQSQQLERDAAEAYVKQETDKLAEAIHRDGQVNLEELGQLVSYGYSYIFKPLDLSGFQFMPLEDIFIKEESTEAEVDSPQEEDTKGEAQEVEEAEQAVEEQPNVIVNSSEEDTLSAPVTETLSPRQEQPEANPIDADTSVYEEVESRRSNGKTYAAIGVFALLLMAALFYFNVFQSGAKSNLSVTTVDTSADELRSRELDSALLALNDTLETSTDSVVTAPTQAPAEPVNHKFTIVIGTHPRLELANAEAEEFNKKGHTHVRVLSPNMDKNLKKVIWDTYATKEERDSALRYVKKNIKADAWPTVIK